MTPEGWSKVPLKKLFHRLKAGRLYDKRTRLDVGLTPILDQSADGLFGHHEDEPAIRASANEPVVTFANHTCAVRLMKIPFSLIQNVFPLATDADVDPRFLFQVLSNAIPQRGYRGHWPELTRRTVLKPPLPEQRKIAGILSSVDDAIEKTQEVIDQVQVVKRGLMQELLARGLPGRHTRFKQTEVGKIPEEWKVLRLGDVCEISHGFAFKGEHVQNEPTDWVLVTPLNFEAGGGFKSERLRFYSGPIDRRYVLSDGDLIVTMTDLSKAADTLGYGALVQRAERYGYLHNQRIGKVRITDGEAVSKEFLLFVLATSHYRKHVLSSASGTTIHHTSPSKILSFTFALPPVTEQAGIAKTLHSLVELGVHTGFKLDGLRAVKSALMSVLLTGELRVTTDTEAA